jgi:hypothetical protein
MMPCERTFNTPITAYTFTGRTEKHVACDVSNHPDLKHWVIVKNFLNYDTQIGVSAEISTAHRVVRFKHCPQFDLPDSSGVRDDSWNSSITLDPGTQQTFGVFLRSDAANGNPQDIDVELVTRRFHPHTATPRPARVTITVTA